MHQKEKEMCFGMDTFVCSIDVHSDPNPLKIGQRALLTATVEVEGEPREIRQVNISAMEYGVFLTAMPSAENPGTFVLDYIIPSMAPGGSITVQLTAVDTEGVRGRPVPYTCRLAY